MAMSLLRGGVSSSLTSSTILKINKEEEMSELIEAGPQIVVKKLTMGQVTECMEQTIGKPLNGFEFMVYNIPSPFLVAAIDDYEAMAYEALPEAVELFKQVNPTVYADIPKVIVQVEPEA